MSGHRKARNAAAFLHNAPVLCAVWLVQRFKFGPWIVAVVQNYFWKCFHRSPFCQNQNFTADDITTRATEYKSPSNVLFDTWPELSSYATSMLSCAAWPVWAVLDGRLRYNLAMMALRNPESVAQEKNGCPCARLVELETKRGATFFASIRRWPKKENGLKMQEEPGTMQ